MQGDNYYPVLCRRLQGPARVLLCMQLLLLAVPLPAQQDTTPEQQEIELESIRNRIRDVKSSIDEAKKDVDSYHSELQQSEMAAAQIEQSLQALSAEVAAKQHSLEQLRTESEGQQQILSSERALLAEQLRTAYKTGRNDFIKLFLNQEDPSTIGRMMTWHDYYTRARSRRIREIRITLENLEHLQQRIDLETTGLQTLRDEQAQSLSQLENYRSSRNSIIANLQSYISTQDEALQSLRRDEVELGKLIENLDTSEAVTALFEELPPFDSMKGKLPWPVEGKIISRFGTEKKEGKLRWNGVRISAASGTTVAAVSAGKVIFADWFRNLGLLIIIDHGNGYMSLYGHNESLIRKPGDFVNPGEPIAYVGDTGGQTESALYFEIRGNGKPLDPTQWCRG